MAHMNTWTEKDFESLSWHDNFVYGFSIVEGEDGTVGQLVFDLDFIVEWLQPPPDSFRFLVAPATLTFYRACDLKVELDYAKVSAATIPFSIYGIEREEKISSNGYKSYRWRMAVAFPDGEITFVADGFKQVLRSPPIESQTQCLPSNLRGAK